MLHLNDQIAVFQGKVDSELKVSKAVVDALGKPEVKTEEELK